MQNNLNEYLKRLNDYESWLKEEIEINRSLIERLCNSINESIKLYLKGLPCQAYHSLCKSLDEFKTISAISKRQKNISCRGEYQ